MERIVTGRLQTKEDAAAVAALIGEYINTADICIFPNNSPGHRDAFVLQEFEDKNSLADDVVGAHHGQVVPLAAESSNAYSGPLVGAMAEQGVYDDKSRAQEHRPDGVMVSVRITNPKNESLVIGAMQAAGAADIDPAHGHWRDGEWANFILTVASQPVERSSN